MTARDEANKLYSEMEDKLASLRSMGALRLEALRNPLQEAFDKLYAVGRKFTQQSPGDWLISVKAIYPDVMQTISTAERQMEPIKRGVLPPAPSEPVYVPGGGQVVIPVEPLPDVTPGKTPWYLWGNVDWRVVGGVLGGLAALRFIWKKARRK